MIRSLTVSAALAASLGCVISAFAQSGQQDIQISASMTYLCTIKGYATAPVLKMTIPVDAKGKVDTTPMTVTVPWALCLLPTDVLATSLKQGVRSANPAPSGFANTIDYKGTATFGKATSNVTSNVNGGVGTVGATKGPTLSPLVIQVTPMQPAQPLVAGSDYQDTLRVTLTPKF